MQHLWKGDLMAISTMAAVIVFGNVLAIVIFACWAWERAPNGVGHTNRNQRAQPVLRPRLRPKEFPSKRDVPGAL